MNGLLSHRVHEMTDRLWLRLSNQSIFITGGTGLFGSWLMESMCGANRRLGTNIKATILTRNIRKTLSRTNRIYHDSAISFVQGDVSDFEFPDSKFSRIIHMATTSAKETFDGADQLEKLRMLINGTERVLQFAVKCEVEKFLFTSSGVVYGDCSAGLPGVPETYKGAPETTDVLSGLAEGKRVAEYLCSYYADKFQYAYTITRCFSFVGPGLPLNLHYAIGNFIGQALEGKTLRIMGDGTAVRSYLYRDDFIAWLLTLLLDGKHGRVYNVGSDLGISIRDLACLIRDLLNPGLDVHVRNFDNRGVGNVFRSRYVPDIARARHELSLDVWTPLEVAIVKTADACRIE